MRERIFKFKKFTVSHSRSAMKVGVDGVLVGAWADISGARSILDAGSGCGLVALMCAQRSPHAHVVGVEVDAPSVEEMTANVAASPWGDRISVMQCPFESLPAGALYDRIVSNPPFFDAGVDASTSRETARHAGGLSPETLISKGSAMLTENGTVTLICPPEWRERVETAAAGTKMHIARLCMVRGLPEKRPKRMLVEVRRGEGECRLSELTLETSPGVPTEAYRELCKDFYLKF